MEGRKEGRKDRKKEGQKEEREEGQTNGRKEQRKEKRKVGSTDGWKEKNTGRKLGRIAPFSGPVLAHGPHVCHPCSTYKNQLDSRLLWSTSQRVLG